MNQTCTCTWKPQWVHGVAYDYIELWHDWNACIIYNPKESQNWHKSEKEGVLLTDMTITC